MTPLKQDYRYAIDFCCNRLPVEKFMADILHNKRVDFFLREMHVFVALYHLVICF
jgi:hypothetical protein